MESPPRRIAVFASHPIQYQAPLWRRLAQHPQVNLLVHYFSDVSLRGGVDPGFGVPIAWDQPLLEGYQHVFLSRQADLGRPREVKIPPDYLRRQSFAAALVNGYDYGFEWQLRRLAAPLHLPLVMRPELSTIPHQGRLRGIAGRLFRRWFYAGVSAFAVIGEQARRSLSSSGVRPEKMFSSPYAVDANLFESSDHFLDREGCRRRIGVPPGNFMLLFSGKLIPRKNPSLVLKALAQSPDRSRVSFVVLGDGPDRAALEQEGAGVLGGNFLLAGFKNQSQLAPYFKAADALVLPSLYESWGLVVNEAMHFGLPVLVSDAVSCAADLVENRDTGLVFRSNDAADLAHALQALMGNEQLLRKFSQNARRVIRQYTPDAATRGIIEALDYAVTANGCARGHMR